jgi:hypothetical protein
LDVWFGEKSIFQFLSDQQALPDRTPMDSFPNASIFGDGSRDAPFDVEAIDDANFIATLLGWSALLPVPIPPPPPPPPRPAPFLICDLTGDQMVYRLLPAELPSDSEDESDDESDVESDGDSDVSMYDCDSDDDIESDDEIEHALCSDDREIIDGFSTPY